jgi:small GTP-binding protein
MALVPMYKVALLGDGNVGKTALRRRFMENIFDNNYMMTIGADFAIKTIELNGLQIKFQIWDLAGQPRFAAVRETYYRGALGALIVFDITSPPSFQNIGAWIESLWKYSGKGQVPIVILGNKLDLRDKYPETVMPEQGKLIAEQLSQIDLGEGLTVPYLETSAKTGENVHQAFALLGQQVSRFIAQRIGN